MGLKKADTKGVFCIEGNWENDLRDQCSVAPALRLLWDALAIPFIHHQIATRPEFDYYLAKWTERRYQKYPILHLAFHGDPDVIWMPEDRRGEAAVTLDDLGDLLEGQCVGRILHLGTCATLDTHGARINRLLLRTGALAVCGYTTYMDWVTSAAIELILFAEMQKRAFNRRGAELIHRGVKEQAPGLAKRLGFRMKVRT